MGLKFACSVLVLKASVVSLGLSSGLEVVVAVTFPAMLEAQPVMPVAGERGWRMTSVPVAQPW